MTTKLSDLLVAVEPYEGKLMRATRDAEVSDLVEALQAEGVGEVRQWVGPITIQPKGRPEIGDDLPPGRYLVVRLEGEHEFD